MGIHCSNAGDDNLNQEMSGWSANVECEIRFVVDEFDTSIIATDHNPIHIKQFYFSTPRHVSQRIRVVGDQAIMTKKVGGGLNRWETECEIIDLAAAQFLCQKFCPYRVVKTRYQLSLGWLIDIYEEPAGLVIAEYEGVDAELQRDQLPAWLIRGRDITDVATNADIARWAHQISAGTLEFSVRDMLNKPLMIILDGGPGSGKTTILAVLQDRLADRAIFVTEPARLLIEGGGISVPIGNQAGMARFERGIFLQHQNLVSLAFDQARRDNKLIVISDRGPLHPLAYLDGNQELFEQACQTTVEYELSRGDLAIFLEMPDESIYARIQNDDPTRWEPYAEATKRNHHLRNVYNLYGDRLIVVPAEDDFSAKVENVYQTIIRLIDIRG